MTTMEILRHVVLLVHLVGFAILFGAWVVEAVSKRRGVTRLMDWGLAIAAVAGLALAAPWGVPEGVEFNYVKIGVKLVILIVIGALLGIGAGRQRKSGSVPPAIFWSIGVLTLANAAIAVLWR